MAVDRNEEVMEMVEQAIRENPDVSNDELQERAAEIDASVGELSARSFNARYPLQVKRKLKQEQKEKTDKATSSSDSDDLRSAVRENLLDFAKAVAGAEDRGAVIDVLLDVDEYVERVMQAAQ